MSEKRPITIDDLYRICHVEDPRISPDGRWIAYVRVTPDAFENDYKRNIWLVAADGGDPLQLTRGGKDTQPRWSPDGKQLAFTSARDEKPQVYLLPVSAPGGEARALTKMPNGADSPAWSPDGTRLAFLAGTNADERAREERGEADPEPGDEFEAGQQKARREHEEKIRWDPRVSWRIPYRTGTSFLDDRYRQIYIVPVAEEGGEAVKARRLTDIDADHEQPEWTPDGRYILTSRTTDPMRDQPWHWQSLYRIYVEDGAEEQLTDESHSDYASLPSPDGQWIAYVRLPMERLAERTPRLTVLPAAGGEPRDLNLALDRSVVDFKWSAGGEALVFIALSEGDGALYRVTLVDTRVEKIIGGRFEAQAHDVHVGGGVAYVASTPHNPSELFWNPPGAVAPRAMTAVNGQFLDEVIVQDVHELRFTPEHGTEIQGWFLLPVGYEAGKTYPLAFNIHGGPHAMWGPSTRSMWHEWQCHAAQGYAVLFCNPRGSDGYGENFQSVLHGGWGDIAFTDLMAGVDAFLEKGIADSERLAVTGGSYGGYMTAWIVGHSDRFKAAVTQRGVYNLLSFYGTTDIPMLTTSEYDVEPWEDPQRLWAHSPLAYAQLIKTPLLILHAENDYRVPIAEAEQLFAYVRRSGGTTRLIRYPRDGHELSRSGEPKHRVSRLTEMLAWFDTYCRKEGAE